jgi:hypothetical protein
MAALVTLVARTVTVLADVTMARSGAALVLSARKGRALAATLGLTEQKVGFYLKQLGCVVEKAGGGKVGVLRLPLQFPKASRGGPPKR